MANKVITMQQIRGIIQLLEKGCSLRAISAQIGLSRQPVTFYAARIKKAPYTLEELRQLADEDLTHFV
jgi:lambda repressor-like predicted transcriptional regulator